MSLDQPNSQQNPLHDQSNKTRSRVPLSVITDRNNATVTQTNKLVDVQSASLNNVSNNVDSSDFTFSPVEIGDPLDPIDVYEYQHHIYKGYRQKELDHPRLVFIQDNYTLKDRNIMVDAICRFHYKLGLTTNTFYRFMGIFDKLLSTYQVPVGKLRLYASASLLIASKLDDVYPAQSSNILKLVENEFTSAELFETEIQLANMIEFDTTFGTGLFFLTQFLRIEDELETNFHYFARYMLELCQTHGNFFGEKPSLMAAVSLYVTRKVWEQVPWTEKLAGYTNYSEEDLLIPSRWVVDMLRESDRVESKFMKRKYGSDLYNEVAHRKLPASL